jgi:hypothetical protein
LDTDGTVFGGFTPVKWKSDRNGKFQDDCSLRSFLFTLRNLHGVPPRKFALRKEKKQDAIYCTSDCCAEFGQWDNYVSGSFNQTSFTSIGTNWSNRTYANDIPFRDFFTGAYKFTVKEIEVFKVTDQIKLPGGVIRRDEARR